MEQQIFPDDILLEIFNRTEPKTATRCRSLSKAWCMILTAYTFRKENTLANTGKHNNLLIQVGLAPWISGPDALSMVDVQDGALIPCVLPFQVTHGGWWSVIGSEHGMVCMHYSEDGLSTSIKVWNPFLKKVRHLPAPTDRMARQAMSGYAFGYSPNTDNYLIVHVSKRHIRDRLVQCHLYSSNEGQWIHRSVNDQRISSLGSNAVMYRRKAFWINWVGRQFSKANDIVTFELDDFRLHKTRIKRGGREHFQCLAISGDFLSLIGYEFTPLGLHLIICRVDVVTCTTIPWKRMPQNRPGCIPSNPSFLYGQTLLTLHEKTSAGEDGDDSLKTEVIASTFNISTQQKENIFSSEWDYHMCFKSALLVSQGLLDP